jgi:hypothetical protein
MGCFSPKIITAARRRSRRSPTAIETTTSPST